MPKYLTIHHEKQIDRVLLESRWSEIAMDTRADWQLTVHNLALGVRFCEWDARDRHVIEEIFRELGIKWTEIVQVNVTSPSEWRLWHVDSGKGMKKCWEVVNCGREPDALETPAAFCPAAVDSLSRQVNDLPFARSLCWKAVGTFCQEKVEGTLHESTIESEKCPFFGCVQQAPSDADQISHLDENSRPKVRGGEDASLHDCSL